MVNTIVDGTFRQTNLKNESSEYLAKREELRLGEIFTKPNRSLVIHHFMLGKKQTKACPMCTAWMDGANGIAHHLAQNLDFAVVAAADLPTLRAFARQRGDRKSTRLN